MFSWHIVDLLVTLLIFIKDSFGEMDGKPYLCPLKKNLNYLTSVSLTNEYRLDL